MIVISNKYSTSNQNIIAYRNTFTSSDMNTIVNLDIRTQIYYGIEIG